MTLLEILELVLRALSAVTVVVALLIGAGAFVVRIVFKARRADNQRSAEVYEASMGLCIATIAGAMVLGMFVVTNNVNLLSGEALLVVGSLLFTWFFSFLTLVVIRRSIGLLRSEGSLAERVDVDEETNNKDTGPWR